MSKLKNKLGDLGIKIYNCEKDFCPTCMGDYFHNITPQTCRDYWENMTGKCYSYKKKIEELENNLPSNTAQNSNNQ